MKDISKYLLRVKVKTHSTVVELVIHLRWVIIYAILVVKKDMYIYTTIYTFFFRDELIVFAGLFRVAVGWQNGVYICKTIGIKLDKPKGKVIGIL